MGEKDFFDTPLVRTKITSADVKIREMLIGYFLAPFCALISNAIFGSYLNRYYSDVIGWTDTAKFGRVLSNTSHHIRYICCNR